MKSSLLFLLLFPVSGLYAQKPGDTVSFCGARFRMLAPAHGSSAPYRLACGLQGAELLAVKGAPAPLSIRRMEITLSENNAVRAEMNCANPERGVCIPQMVSACHKGGHIVFENITVADSTGKEFVGLVQPLTLEKL